MPPGIDESLAFVPVAIAVLTVSDTRAEESDRSGGIVAGRIRDAGHRLAERARSCPTPSPRSGASFAPGSPIRGSMRSSGPTALVSPAATSPPKDGWDGIIAAQLDARHRPCNLVELMPRLTEGGG